MLGANSYVCTSYRRKTGRGAFLSLLSWIGLRSHLVYKFSCKNCNATYYGKSGRQLNVRSSELIGLSPLTGNRVACNSSAISDHLLLQEHNNNNFNDFSTLCCENNRFKLSLRESILIKKTPPELKKNVSSMPLLLFN